MLKSKHLVFLVALLAVLALVSVGQRMQHTERTGRSAVTVLVDGTWTGGTVSRLVLGHGTDAEAVVLENGTEGWVVATAWGAAANGPRVDAVLRAVSDLNGEFRSDDPGVLADYGLGDTTSVSIRAWNKEGEEVLALEVGGKPDRHPGNFVRRPGTSDVYVTGQSLLSPLGLYGGPARPGSRHFLELQAVTQERNDVDAIVLVDEHGERRLVKDFAMTEPAADDTTGALPEIDRLTWEWRLDSPGEEAAPGEKTLAKPRADGVLGALCRVRAVDVDDPNAPADLYGLGAPARRAMLVFADGSELALVFGAAREAVDDAPAGTWMRVGDDPTVWVVAEHSVTGIFKTVEELLPES